jgi:hypothetical protein
MFLFFCFLTQMENPSQRKTPYRKGRRTKGKQAPINQSPKVYQEILPLKGG